MFTGLIESVEPMQSNTSSPAGRRLCVPLGKIAEGVKPGDSICVNGVCLTVSELKGSVATCDVMAETARVSTIGQLKAGELLNWERALAADGLKSTGRLALVRTDACNKITYTALMDGRSLRAGKLSLKGKPGKLVEK